jgi:hypothetical protein
MTLPSSFPISESQIAAEVGLSLPVSSNNAWLIALAGKAALPYSASDFLGKTGHFSGSKTVQQAGQFNYFVDLGGAPLFDATLNGASETNAAAYLSVTTLTPPTNYTGPIIVTNVTLNRSLVLSYVGSGTWGGSSGGGAGGIGLQGQTGQTYALTIYPHA